MFHFDIPRALPYERIFIRRGNPMDQSATHTIRNTVLVVDDDALILNLVSQLLIDGEYNVLTAADGKAGLRQSRDYKGEIHLLLSDLEMPGLSGVDLATTMTLERPGLRVLLMSGFAAGILILNEGWYFLAKPFAGAQLRAIVAGLVASDAKQQDDTA
jgi:DNA-binding NtrC family response regulator